MDINVLKNTIEDAWNRVKKGEQKIIKNDVNELTISQCLCCELRNNDIFRKRNWKIHSEYNRQGDSRYSKPGSRRPDIIIHRPTKTAKEDNLLYIEMKKHTGGNAENDRGKCGEFTSEVNGKDKERKFQYQYALLLMYGENGEVEWNWFKDGEDFSP